MMVMDMALIQRGDKRVPRVDLEVALLADEGVWGSPPAFRGNNGSA